MAESFVDVGYYVADAQKTMLPLLGNSEGGPDGHDWNYLLNTLGILDKTDAIAGAAFFFRRIDIYRRFFGNGILYLFGFYKAFNFC